MQGLDVCRDHMGKLNPKAVVKTGDRLIALTGLALDRLEKIITEGADDVAERAARTILDRTVPKPGAQHALIVNVGQGDAAPGPAAVGPAETIRRRLLALASSAADKVENPAPLGDFGSGDDTQSDAWARRTDEVIDAEIVEDPEPPLVAPAPPTMPPAADTTEPEQPAYVPRTTTRLISFDEFAQEHDPWG
jgi:hypothetical protein